MLGVGHVFANIPHKTAIARAKEDDDEDGVCNGNEVAGCQDSQACNYNPNATSLDPDLPCLYPVPGYNCLGECIQDVNQNGLCDILEEQGCMDEEACNYNPNATIDDASCTYPPVGGICDCFTDLSITETLSGGGAGTPATFTGTGEASSIESMMIGDRSFHFPYDFFA